jgi:hypothetical protein
MHYFIIFAAAWFLLPGLFTMFCPTERRQKSKLLTSRDFGGGMPSGRPWMSHSETQTWAQYAMRNPEVKLQIVEKLEVANGQFSAEKHMKMTGPVPRSSVFPGGPSRQDQLPGSEIDRTGLPF